MIYEILGYPIAEGRFTTVFEHTQDNNKVILHGSLACDMFKLLSYAEIGHLFEIYLVDNGEYYATVSRMNEIRDQTLESLVSVFDRHHMLETCDQTLLEKLERVALLSDNAQKIIKLAKKYLYNNLGACWFDNCWFNWLYDGSDYLPIDVFDLVLYDSDYTQALQSLATFIQ